MNILMIEVPSIAREGEIPFGTLYAASSARRAGHSVRVIDLVKAQGGYDDVRGAIQRSRPELIGLGGITASYRNCKELVAMIKADYPGIMIVAGGVMSSVADLLLTKAGVDYVVHGEGEITFPNLICALERGSGAAEVRGISFLRHGAIVRTEDEPQVVDLDTIPPPDYTLLNMKDYLDPVSAWVDAYFRYDKRGHEKVMETLGDKKYIFPIITARGCTHRCIFCYRHNKGLRQHSVDYVISMIRHLRDTYGVGVFKVNDELTTGNKSWVSKFCDRLIDEKLNIFVVILSSRVDNVDENILKKLRAAGCLMINYGYESGSDTILKEIGKGVTREQALKAGLLTAKAGIKNVPEVIIGFPSETEETISETIDFLKQLETWPVSVNTPIPFPETPLWQHAVEQGLIKDKEKFVLGYKRRLFVNFTKFSDRKLSRLVTKVQYDPFLHWLKARREYGRFLKYFIIKHVALAVKSVRPYKRVSV